MARPARRGHGTVTGLAAAGTILVAVMIALTVLPALLGFVGTRTEGGATQGRHAVGGDRDPVPLFGV